MTVQELADRLRQFDPAAIVTVRLSAYLTGREPGRAYFDPDIVAQDGRVLICIRTTRRYDAIPTISGVLSLGGGGVQAPSPPDKTAAICAAEQRVLKAARDLAALTFIQRGPCATEFYEALDALKALGWEPKS